MKVFLFLYPIGKYVDQLLGRIKRESIDWYPSEYHPERINEIIENRYRVRDFQIVWVFFADSKDRIQPDVDAVSEFIKLDKKDIVLSNNITFSEHIGEKVYPDSNRILESLSRSKIKELIIAGYHQYDCVERLARSAYEGGLNVKVDEDLTDQYFSRMLLYGMIPYHRGKSLLPEIISRMEDWEAELFKNTRLERPWLEQL